MDTAERLRPYVAGLAATWHESMPDVRHRGVEGTLAFVDISGFTTLTERLAAKGKVGAEEMSDLLNEAFATLLEVAYGYGASLVKWGGDAVLLLYEGGDHAAHGCRASLEMQRTMRRIGRLRTSVGVVQLKMSVGISSGTFDFFLVGERHRELLVAGPAATETAVMEQIAEAGEVVVSSATASLLPAGVLGPAKEAGRLLTSAPPADPRSRWWPRVHTDHVADCLDPMLREHLLTEVGDSEHRQVAVGFVEVSGVDDLLEQQGPGATAGALHELMTVVQNACAHHRVTFWETDISKDGFKILLIAGAPKTSGHDEDAMLRACRSILDEYSGPVRLRIGVNTGRVFNGGFGPPFRRTWSVKGDAVNLGARVMGKAETGQLVATEALLRRVASRVDAELLPPFMVKGKRHPVHAAVVHRVSSARVVDNGRAGAFVGRRAEMDVLLEAVRNAARGRGSGIVVTGDPGIGKSRLADHVVNRVDERTTVLRGFGDDYESATAYYAVRRLLRAAIGQSVDAPDAVVAKELRRRVRARCPALEPLLPLLSVPFDVDLPDTPETEAVQDEFRRPRTMSLVVEFLSAVLTGPTVLLVDDVQFADDLSVELLNRLMISAAERPWLAVIVGREAPAALSGNDDVASLVVPPLSAEDARALVLDTPGGESLAPHVLREVVGRGEGNPLFLHELTLAVVDSGGEELPSSLEDLLAAQIDDLAPSARQLLRSVSVLGARFDEPLAVELLGQKPTPEQWSALDRFLAQHADGSRRFRTRLARDAAYEGLPFRRRVELHGRAADALEPRATDDDDHTEALSLHCFVAQRYDDAWRYSRIAGDRACRMYANTEALTFYRRARSVARRVSDASATLIAELDEAIGDVCARLADLENATDAYRDGRRSAPRDALLLRGRLAMNVGLCAAAVGSMTKADRWLATATRELAAAMSTAEIPRTAAGLDARVCVERAHNRFTAGRPRAARSLCLLGIEKAESADAMDVIGRGLLLLDMIDLVSGLPSDEARVRRALALFERTGDLARQAAALNHLGMTAYFKGEWDEAIEAYRRAASAQERTGDEWSAAIAWGNVAEILLDQGRLQEAEPLVEGALRTWRVSKTPHSIGFGARLLGRLRSRSGQHAQAMALFVEARDAFAAMDEVFELVDTQMCVAEALLLVGIADEAIRQLDDAVGGLRAALSASALLTAEEAGVDGAPLSATQTAVFERLYGYAHAQLGDSSIAKEHFDRSVTAARLHSSSHDEALAAHALAWLDPAGDPGAAIDAERLLSGLGVVWVPEMPREARFPAAAHELPQIPGQRNPTGIPV